LNLSGDELDMYQRVHDALAERIETPDLVIFLRADTDLLMRRIAMRDRPYERGMARDYIDSLRRAYDAFFAAYKQGPMLTLDANRLDFVANDDDRDEAVAQVLGALGRAPRQEALPGFNGEPALAASPASGEDTAAAPPDLLSGERRLGDFQQFHHWLDAAKSFDQDPFFNFILLQEEIGELARLMSRQWGAKRDQGEPPAREDFAAEMADVLAYLLKLANYLGVDLEAAYLDKMRVNAGRRWR